MYFLRGVTFALPLGIIPQLVYSSPTITTITQRQDTVIAGLGLPDCFDFSFKGSKFSAICISADGTPAFSSIDLDSCIANDNRNMVYLFK
jgi:hypothetical protein